MKTLGTFLTAALLAACVTTTAFADEKEGRIKTRKERQQGRIAEGVKSGELTPAERAKIETKESNLNKEIRSERAANGGTLTPKEKAQVNRRQNRISKDIAKQKHDKQTQNP